MERYIQKSLIKDLNRKPVLLSGPRQCGKTVLSKQLQLQNYQYLNFDVIMDRKIILKMNWHRDKELIIFDELHKMKKWKTWLKGIFDSNTPKQKFLVTGSAKLNTFKKVGDSLAGRYFNYRLYPLDLYEIMRLYENPINQKPLRNLLNNSSLSSRLQLCKEFQERLLSVSGFPEPFLEKESGFYVRWQQTHLDIILKQDLLDTENIKSIKQIEILATLLTERVGSLLSYNSLREDLHTDDKSIKRWVDILENAYVIFRIYPFSNKKMVTSIKKAPKVYFFDYGRVDDLALRVENLVAFSLLKQIHYQLDVKGIIYDLHYVRNKQKKEIDFLVTKNKKPHLLIEVKLSNSIVSENFVYFEKYFPNIKKIQVVRELDRGYLSREGVQVMPLHLWLADLDLE